MRRGLTRWCGGVLSTAQAFDRQGVRPHSGDRQGRRRHRPSFSSFRNNAYGRLYLQYTIDARPTDAERLGNLCGRDSLGLHLTHLRRVYRSLPGLCRRPRPWPWRCPQAGAPGEEVIYNAPVPVPAPAPAPGPTPVVSSAPGAGSSCDLGNFTQNSPHIRTMPKMIDSSIKGSSQW